MRQAALHGNFETARQPYGPAQTPVLKQVSAVVKTPLIAVATAGNAVAVPRAIKATNKTYSIKSCPSSSFHSLFKIFFILLVPFVVLEGIAQPRTTLPG
jgi:hypothetical protein